MPNRKSKHFVTFPAFSYDKIALFHKIRKEKGLSAFECSFLLGKHDFFIRDAENPFKPTLIDPEDSVHLAKIFALEDYNPPLTPLDLYKLKVEEVKIDRKRTKRIIRVESDLELSNAYLEICTEEKEDELETQMDLSGYAEVQTVFRDLLQQGYFDHTRTALEIFDTFRAMDQFGPDFHPRYLIQTIRYFLNKKSGEPLLDNSRTNLFSRRLFFKPMDFENDYTSGSISKAFRDVGLQSFRQAADWVNHLPYRRNTDKNNPLCLFEDRSGTCSTKHALLKRLADENGNTVLKLMLGIFTMNAKNTPAVKEVLKKYNLKYMPEAHNYLRAYNYIIDVTGIGINETKLELDLLDEIEITPEQLAELKVSYHREYLSKWIADNAIPYSLEELWTIREECIRAITLAQLELQTERLLLRPFRKEDGAAMYALNDDPEVLRYTGDVQFADVSAVEDFLANYDQYEKYGVGRLLVIEKNSGEILGWCGLKYHPEPDEYDIGYRFFKKYWGQGYATESAMAVLQDGATRLGVKHIVGRALVENTASIRVFEKLDMQLVKDFVEDGENWVLYSI